MTSFPESLKSHVIYGGFPVMQTAQSSLPCLLDPMNQLHHQYGVTDPCIYLIRPDMYVAFRGRIDHQTDLANYLNQLLIPAQKYVSGA